jgi:hypothetical protein
VLIGEQRIDEGTGLAVQRLPRDACTDSGRYGFAEQRGSICRGFKIATFLEWSAPLGDKLSTVFLQLPPKFDGTRL